MNGLITPATDKLGTESAFGLLAEIEALKLQGKHIINLGIGQPNFHPPMHVQEAAIKAIHDGHHGYTPAKGILDLRVAVLEDLIRRHAQQAANGHYLSKVDPGQVMIVPGGKVTIHQAVTLLGNKDSEIIYPNPSFSIYKSLIDYSGAKAVSLDLTKEEGYAPTAQALRPLLNDKTRLVILNSPGNPTGAITSPYEVKKIAELIAEYPNCMLLSDEIYDGLVFNNLPHLSFTTQEVLKDQLILLDGWSKRYAMTGWRVGMGVWPKKLVPFAERMAINHHSCVNAPAQFAALAALTHDQSGVTEMCDAFSKRAYNFVKGLHMIKGIEVVPPKGAFYAFADIEGTGFSAKELQSKLLHEAEIGALDGEGFGTMGKGHIRFSLASSSENLDQALIRMQQLLA